MMRRRPVMRTVARTAVIAGTATVVAGGVRRHQESKQQAQQGQAPAAAAAPAAPDAAVDPNNAPPVAGSPEAIEQLKELAALKDQGILTDEEFTAQKAKLLGLIVFVVMFAGKFLVYEFWIFSDRSGLRAAVRSRAQVWTAARANRSP